MVLLVPVIKNSSAVAPESAPVPNEIVEPLLMALSLIPFAPPEDEIELKLPLKVPVVRSSAGPLPLMIRSAVVSVPKVVPLMPLDVDEPVVRVRPRTVLVVAAAFRFTAFEAAVELLRVVNVPLPGFITGRGNESAGTETPEID